MKLLITIVFNFILLVSAYALFALIARPETQNDDTSDLRFKFMLALHLLFFIAMLIQLKLDETYDLMLLVFSVVVITATALFICEEKVQRVQRSPGYNYSHLDFES
jgi:L-asparagine transporter-like permease